MHRTINSRSDRENSRRYSRVGYELSRISLSQKKYPMTCFQISNSDLNQAIQGSRVLAVLVPLIIVWEVYIMLKR